MLAGDLLHRRKVPAEHRAGVGAELDHHRMAAIVAQPVVAAFQVGQFETRHLGPESWRLGQPALAGAALKIPAESLVVVGIAGHASTVRSPAAPGPSIVR